MSIIKTGTTADLKSVLRQIRLTKTTLEVVLFEEMKDPDIPIQQIRSFEYQIFDPVTGALTLPPSVLQAYQDLVNEGFAYVSTSETIYSGATFDQIDAYATLTGNQVASDDIIIFDDDILAGGTGGAYDNVTGKYTFTASRQGQFTAYIDLINVNDDTTLKLISSVNGTVFSVAVPSGSTGVFVLNWGDDFVAAEEIYVETETANADSCEVVAGSNFRFQET